MTDPRIHVSPENSVLVVQVAGDWQLGKSPDWDALQQQLEQHNSPHQRIKLTTDKLGSWDSSLALMLLQLIQWCGDHNIPLDTSASPEGLQNLLNLATSVPVFKPAEKKSNTTLLLSINRKLMSQWAGLRDSLIFIGDIFLGLGRWVKGEAKTRGQDILFFIEHAGPKALPIVTLISALVGMILAYLGSVQLRELGAQVYVADLVAIGMVREMGALMTAIIVAGRTGAAYAAQLGTMQVNEEIDALRTLGIPSMEFLVLPRLLALVFVMPLLCIYADIIGMAGGALVASGMDVSFRQYILQTQGAIDWVDMMTGIFKSLAFGILIAMAGCQAGLQCGRSSTAVGIATTKAVVTAIVYLVVADAAFNILYDRLGI